MVHLNEMRLCRQREQDACSEFSYEKIEFPPPARSTASCGMTRATQASAGYNRTVAATRSCAKETASNQVTIQPHRDRDY